MSADTDRQLTHSDHRTDGGCFSLVILLDSVGDPANVGSIFRVADALGVARLMLCGHSVVPPSRRLARTSRATEKSVVYEYCEDPVMAAVGLRERGYRLIAVELTERSVDLKTVDFNEHDKLCLILGAEQAGVSAGLLEIVDQTVHIPMLGQNSSMNVAIACAITVYEATRAL